MNALRILPVCAALALSACVAPPPRPAPEPPRVELSTIGVVPADVEYTFVTFEGDNPRLAAEESAIRERLARAISSRVGSRGFEVRGERALDEAAAVVPDIRFQTTQLQGAFLQTLEQMGASDEGGGVTSLSRRHTVGPQVARVADPIDADALVLTRFMAYKKSGGEIAKDVFKGVLGAMVGVQNQTPAKFAILVVALVDAGTGDILWDRMTWSAGEFETTELDAMVERLFFMFPRAATKPALPARMVTATAPAPAAEPAPAPAPAPTDSTPAAGTAQPVVVADADAADLGRCAPATVRAMKRDGASESEISGACNAPLEAIRTFLR